MTIGERIKKRRKELGISVDQLADILDKNRATIYRYESDEIENLSITVLDPLAKALCTTPAYLMGWNDVYEIKDDIRCVAESHVEYNVKEKSEDKKMLDRLMLYYYKLNKEGKEEALKRIEELTYIPTYSER